MKGLRILGDYVFEYLLISVLLILSFILIIPFIPIYIGVVSYFRRNIDDRMLKDIFKPIKENIKIIIIFTIFELLILVFSGLNIYFMNTNLESMNEFILIVSYIGFFIGIYFMIFSPIIILNMNVNFRQLVFNSIFVVFGSIKNSLLSIICMVGYLLIGTKIPYIYIIGIYFIPYVISKLTYKNLLTFKALRLNTTVEELTKKENHDDYLDEYGYVNHDDKKEN